MHGGGGESLVMVWDWVLRLGGLRKSKFGSMVKIFPTVLRFLCVLLLNHLCAFLRLPTRDLSEFVAANLRAVLKILVPATPPR